MLASDWRTARVRACVYVRVCVCARVYVCGSDVMAESPHQQQAAGEWVGDRLLRRPSEIKVEGPPLSPGTGAAARLRCLERGCGLGETKDPAGLSLLASPTPVGGSILGLPILSLGGSASSSKDLPLHQALHKAALCDCGRGPLVDCGQSAAVEHTSHLRCDDHAARSSSTIGGSAGGGGSTGGAAAAAAVACDACSGCDDVCDDLACAQCEATLNRMLARKCKKQAFTRCQLRRHASEQSCWVAANKTVYDCTRFLASGGHPGGGATIMKSAGTVCTADFKYHTKGGKRLWGKMAIGKLVPCSAEGSKKKAPMPWSSGEW